MKEIHFIRILKSKYEYLIIEGTYCEFVTASEWYKKQDELRVDKSVKVFDHQISEDEIISGEQTTKYEQK